MLVINAPYNFTRSAMDPYFVNGYGERMADDVGLLCRAIERLGRMLGVDMEYKPNSLFTSIIQFIEMRKTTPFHAIRGPTRKPTAPIGWTQNHEMIWRQWLYHRVSLTDWQEHIIAPIFGGETRFWEPEGWRDELHLLLPHWFVRSLSRFEEIDPTSYPEEEEVVTAKKKQGTDPYLEDYYERR